MKYPRGSGLFPVVLISLCTSAICCMFAGILDLQAQRKSSAAFLRARAGAAARRVLRAGIPLMQRRCWSTVDAWFSMGTQAAYISNLFQRSRIYELGGFTCSELSRLQSDVQISWVLYLAK
ncbi:hypothetical protein EJ06DRAFT_284979 [Trichodelitschia bisporula]|uniref:Uncharacterized protein n=1 Tax=Trichodelitschia bisporula TaxID=703511 RepID=A0A6G1I5N4_9PEZI|nr:hypothetical protein EJ06DRAFT_284979 [Trichodelitschia bisporula]